LYVVRPVRNGSYDYQPNTEDVSTKVIQLRYGSATNIATIIRDVVVRAVNQRNWNRLLTTRQPGVGEVILVPTEVPPTITADTFTNSIIVRGTSAQITEIIDVIQLLDIAVSDIYEVRVIHLKYADAFTVQMIVNQSMSVVVGNSTGIDVSVYGYGNAVVIRCPKTKWAHVNGIVIALDTEVPYTSNTIVIKTYSGNSIVLSDILRRVFGR